MILVRFLIMLSYDNALISPRWPGMDLSRQFYLLPHCDRRYSCLLVAQHPSNMLVYLRDGSAHNCMSCHMKKEVADQTFYLTQSQYTDTKPTRTGADPTTLGTCRVATGVPIFKSLEGLDPEKSQMLQTKLVHTRTASIIIDLKTLGV